MDFKVVFGGDFDETLLESIMDVDRECYEGEYVGELKNMIARYREIQESFVCILDEDTVVGYINFFPVCDELWDDIISKGNIIRDDDIEPFEMMQYKEHGNHLYILSVAIKEKYRDQKFLVKLLTDSFIEYLNRLNNTYKIDAIAGTAVSQDGKKYLRGCRFNEVRRLSDGNVVYVCEGTNLKRFLSNDLGF